jgi:hypothetical protein
MKHCVVGLLVAAGLLFGPTALAQDATDDTPRAKARRLGYAGIDAYDAGDYEAAVEKLERAFQLVQVPTLGLWAARALQRTGRFVEASERYTQVTRLGVTGGEAQEQMRAQEQAQAQARAEYLELVPRIPTVRVRIEGAEPTAVEVTIDDVVLPAVMIGAPKPVNPGTRKIVGRHGDEVVSEEVTLAEGQSSSMVLTFVAGNAVATQEAPPPAPSPTPVEDTAAPSAPAPRADATGDQPPADAGSTQRTVGWFALGVGAIGVTAGSVSGLMAVLKKNKLSDECPDDVCAPSAHDDADTVNALRGVSTVGFVVGGVGLAAAATLLLTAPSEQTAAATVRPWFGVGSAGLVGTF